MIVTIDGPAGVGKSSVARTLAERLGFHFLDTGAMYRAVAWAALHHQLDFGDPAAITDLASRIRIHFDETNAVTVDGTNVSQAIRTVEVTEHVKYAANNEAVRAVLVNQQRAIGNAVDNLVTEGRDQGTVVFPNAECKIYLTATAEVRANRRLDDMLRQGERVSFLEVLKSLNNRDHQDSTRKQGPLAQAEDAIEVFTDEMTQEQVLNHLVWVVESSRS